MNATSSTTKAAAGYGSLGVIVIGAIGVFFPDVYARMVAVPGFTEGLAVGFATLMAKLQKENVMRKQIEDSIANGD
jgi:multisubunit Na+/H+ antiporter MnhG subunit